jgi:glucan endo-1,3-alpha-glucosidase
MKTFRIGILAAVLAALSQMPAPAAPSLEIPDIRLSSTTFFQPNTSFLPGRKVFGWYMLCCGPFGGNNAPEARQIDQYKAEIQSAQSMGIDGFGLDVMNGTEEYHTAISAMFKAAEQLNSGFKLFFEFDSGHPGRELDYVALMKQYAQSPYYYTVNGKAMMGSYAADGVARTPQASVEWWQSNIIAPVQSAGIGVYFVPTTFAQLGLKGYGDVSTTRTEIANWQSIAQGLSMWQIQKSPIGGGLPVLERQATALHDAGKSWMGTVAAHYWVRSFHSVPSWYWEPGKPAAADNTNGTYYEHAGGQGLAQQWQSIIDVQKPEWVMLLTWNDVNESYMEPVDDYKKYKNGTASGAPLGWYKPQIGMDELSRYYIQWYKTGSKPQITADSLFYNYRTHSYKLTAAKDNREPVKIGNGPIGDDIYVTTALTAPATLEVTSGGQTSKFNVAAGIAHTVLPFNTGSQSFSLWRNGTKLTGVAGEPVVDAIDFYDYWPTTGFAEAGITGQ